MRKKKKWLVGMLVIVNVFLLFGCGKRQETRDDKVHIGVTYYNQSDTFLNELLAQFKEQLKNPEHEELEATVTILDAAGSQRTQDDQVKELIDMGCDVLCVNLVDRADPSEIIDLARDHDVPIIFFNREPVEEDLRQWDELYYVGAEAKQSGVMQGELAAEVIQKNTQIDKNRDGKIQYVVLEGEAGHQDSIIRTGNAVDTIKNSGIELEKLSYQIANWNRAQAQTRMMQLIGEYKTDIEMVIANSDSMVLGAVDAYEKLGYTESNIPVFFGIDGTKEGLKAVQEGKIAATVYNDKEGQAKAMVKLITAAVTGKGMENITFENKKCIYLPYKKVTKENVSSMIP